MGLRRNPVGVVDLSVRLPRVARSSAFAWLRRDESQPWAGGRNPYGIEGGTGSGVAAHAFLDFSRLLRVVGSWKIFFWLNLA